MHDQSGGQAAAVVGSIVRLISAIFVAGNSALADFPKGPPYVNGADEASRRRLGRTNGLEPRRRKLKRPQALSLCGRRAQN